MPCQAAGAFGELELLGHSPMLGMGWPLRPLSTPQKRVGA